LPPVEFNLGVLSSSEDSAGYFVRSIAFLNGFTIKLSCSTSADLTGVFTWNVVGSGYSVLTGVDYF
jgi:hypothetical protein